MDWSKFRKSLFFVLLGFALKGCLEPYSPGELTSDLRLLIIDGFLTSDNSTGVIKLSRSSSLSDKKDAILETGAQVLLEDGNNNLMPLIESQPGNYSLTTQLPNVGMDYRLKIKTSNEKEYLSDFVTLKPTPEIDSVYWRPDLSEKEIMIFVSTHDPASKTRKYRWRFTETWEYHSRFPSAFELENGTVYARYPQDMRAPHNPNVESNITSCWQELKSANVLIESTDKLEEDIVSSKPLTNFNWLDERLGERYSILVEQYAISNDEYEYWNLLKKNTENLGTLFDPLPSQVSTNIKTLSNPNEIVLGYFSLYEKKSLRIFIDANEVESYFGKRPVVYDNCVIEKLPLEDIGESISQTLNAYLIDEWWSEGFPDEVFRGYFISRKDCLDCRLKGGVNKKPSFW